MDRWYNRRCNSFCNGQRQCTVLDGSNLKIHTSDGSLSSHLRLPNDFEEPRCAIGTKNDSFLVSRGGSAEFGIHRIREISMNGEILRSYGGQRGSQKAQIDWPVYMSLDDEGQVFVMGEINVRILVLDSDLRLQRVLLTRDDGIDASLRISYVKESETV